MGSWAAAAGIALDPRAEVPIGVQVDWSLRAAIASGRLQPGERLPGLRDLADELGVNHNTLRAAVAKLEQDGLLERRHGSGTFVAPGAAAHERHAPLVEQVARWAADAGLTPREVAAALYVRESAAAAEPDAAAEERRALRDDIVVLERVLAQLQWATGEMPPAAPAERTAGPRLLGLEELREQRRLLVRRLAETQRALEGEDAASAPEAPAAEAPATMPARRPRRAPAVRPQPT